jgi:activator of HSP90 ATPase
MAAKKKKAAKRPAPQATKKKTAAKKAAKKKKTAANKATAKKATAKKATGVQRKAKASKAASSPRATRTSGGEAQKATTTIVQHVFIQATPEQVFDALVQPALAAAVVGGECTGDPVVGATFTQWNGYITGKHLELLRGERIVQEWSTTEWPKGAAPSRLELSLVGTSGGTELTMTHSNVPSSQSEDYRQGWIDYYWTPMRTYFAA